MAINIQSLFADIIDTPEQRQQKLLQQGMAQGQLLASGLRGRAAALAPLAQVAGQLGVQRQEDLRRAVQPMIGIDPRTDSEKLQEKLGSLDTSTPQGLMEAARAMQSVDPIRAAALRQAAAELNRELSDRERTMRRQDEADARAKAAEERAEAAEKRAKEEAERAGTRFEWQTEQDRRNRTTFENSITEFNNRQFDRELTNAERQAKKEAAQVLKSSLADEISTADPSNPYLGVLQSEDTFIPLNELRLIENQFKQGMKPNIGVYTVFDPNTNKNVIMSFDKETGKQLNTFGESAQTLTNREREVPNLSKRRKTEIGDALDGEDLFKNYKIYDMVTGEKNTGRNALIDMIHNYSERNNESYMRSIAAIKSKLQEIDNAPIEEQTQLKAILGRLLSSGFLPSEVPDGAEEEDVSGITVEIIE